MPGTMFDEENSRREDQGPLPADQRELNREKSDHGTDNTRQVNINVLPVRVGDGSLAGIDVVSEENEREEGTGQVERPGKVVSPDRLIVAEDIVLTSSHPCRR